MLHREALTRFDLTLLTWLHTHVTRSGHILALATTVLGSPHMMIALAVGVGLMLAARKRWILLEGWGIALFGGEVLNQILKRVIHRPRPIYSSILSPHSWSFPSGHAMGSLIGYGMLAYLLIVLLPGAARWRAAIIAAAVALVLAIGVSRLYLGVHYFSDVVGGYAVGVLWLSACVSRLEVARRRAAAAAAA